MCSTISLAKYVAGFVAAPQPLSRFWKQPSRPWSNGRASLVYCPDRLANHLSMRELRRFSAMMRRSEMLSAESIWVSQTWGGGKALAQSGYGWGAWVDGVLASVACTFFLGNEYEDIGVVTEPGYRGNGSQHCLYL